jgi:Cys-rich protein (TIGR01571 family)
LGLQVKYLQQRSGGLAAAVRFSPRVLITTVTFWFLLMQPQPGYSGPATAPPAATYVAAPPRGPPRAWRSGLFDAAYSSDNSSCIAAHLCWPFVAGQVAERTGGSYGVDCCVGGVVGCVYCFYCVPWAITRQRLRRRLNIKGSFVEDALVTLFCPPFYLTQATHELDREDAERDAARSPPAQAQAQARPAGVPAATLAALASGAPK